MVQIAKETFCSITGHDWYPVDDDDPVVNINYIREFRACKRCNRAEMRLVRRASGRHVILDWSRAGHMPSGGLQ